MSRPRRFRRSEAGFTLAAMIVLLTILSVVVAYTVPQLWSDVMHRERDRQTIWVMKQYARAINEYQKKRGALPTKIDDLKEQNNPRVARALYPDPLTGKMDWILVAPGQGPSIGPNPAPPNQPNPPATATSDANPRDYVGPFVGVRPPLSGTSFLELNGQTSYELWSYTIQDLLVETGAAPAPNPAPGPAPKPGK